jgi:hypothetical protein
MRIRRFEDRIQSPKRRVLNKIRTMANVQNCHSYTIQVSLKRFCCRPAGSYFYKTSCSCSVLALWWPLVLWFLLLRFRKGRRNHIDHFVCCPSPDSTTSLSTHKILLCYWDSVLYQSSQYLPVLVFFNLFLAWLYYEILRREQHLFHWVQDRIFCMATTLLKLFHLHYGMFKRRNIAWRLCTIF